jgi:predicted dehydrogenase
MTQALRFGIVGIGGYGGHILSTLRASSSGVNPPVKLMAVCDPDVNRFKLEMNALREAGLSVYTKLDDLLNDTTVQAVWLPVPINLHTPFTLAALDAGKAVMCEKPAAGTVDEVDRMIAARDRTGLLVAIGFQDIYDPLVQDAKRRILAGEIGSISNASVWGVWPRDSHYYSRNTWAGALRRGDDWVLDSPASNAMAHFITLLLFLMGPTQEESAVPISIEAELYRANPIENYDTCGLRITIEGGGTLLVLLTHAGRRECPTECVLTGSKGTLSFDGRDAMAWSINGKTQSLRRVEPHADMVRSFAGRFQGDPSSPIATLETAWHHTVVINGASQAAAVKDIPQTCIESVHRSSGAILHAINGIETVLAECAAGGKLLHESGLCAWTKPPAKLDLRGYRHFEGTPA